MRLLNGAALTAALLLVAAASPAQSLGDAAAKEKARRKTVSKPGKVITDEDLRTGGGTVSGGGAESASPNPSPSPGAAGATGATGATGAKKEKTEDELKAEAQADWRKRLDAANQEASTARERVNQIQLALNDTSGGVFTPRRAGLQTQFEDAQQKAAAAEQKVAALTEEGRRNGWR
jgi:hypothetical protein